jgi:hypothetical protein
MLRKVLAKFAAVAACGVFAAAGCGPGGPQFGEVSGKVTVKGNPVTAGEVYFKVADAEYSGSALLKADGTYSSKSIPVGKCKVMIKTKSYNPNPEKKGSSAPGSSSGSGGGGSRPPGSGSGPPPGYTGGPSGGGGRPAPNTTRPDWLSKTNPNDPGPGKYVPTPEKYESETTTTLEYEVKTGQNTFDIDLKD